MPNLVGLRGRSGWCDWWVDEMRDWWIDGLIHCLIESRLMIYDSLNPEMSLHRTSLARPLTYLDVKLSAQRFLIVGQKRVCTSLHIMHQFMGGLDLGPFHWHVGVVHRSRSCSRGSGSGRGTGTRLIEGGAVQRVGKVKVRIVGVGHGSPPVARHFGSLSGVNLNTE